MTETPSGTPIPDLDFDRQLIEEGQRQGYRQVRRFFVALATADGPHVLSGWAYSWPHAIAMRDTIRLEFPGAGVLSCICSFDPTITGELDDWARAVERSKQECHSHSN